MAIETIVGHNPSQIWVIREKDTKQVVDLSLIPVCPVVQAGYRGDRGGLICVCLDPDAGVVSHRQEIIYDLEALISGGVIDCGDVCDACELGGSVVFEEGEGWDNAGRRDVDGEFVFPDREPDNRSVCWFTSCYE